MSYFFSQHLNHPHAQQPQQQHHPAPPTNLGAATPGHNHHGGRSRRGNKMGGAQHAQKQFRGVKSMRELAEAPAITAFRARFEAGRSFDLDDDLEFCPALLTEDDLHSIQSAVSDRSSLSSGSPDASPLQHQIQPAQHVNPSISLSPASLHTYSTLGHNMHQSKLQPSAARTKNAIPIVNPSTGMRVSSPPTSMSSRGMHQDHRRW